MREAEWQRMCPPIYRQTDPEHEGIDRSILKEVTEWRPGPNGVGLGLVGPSGSGKTRMCWLLMRKLHFGGVPVAAIQSTEFAKCAARQFSDDPDEKARAKRRLNRIRNARVLFIDDLGKERFTARVETELYDLVEARTQELLPIIFTSQLSGSSLAAMLSKENAEAILRRLREFTAFIKCEPSRGRKGTRRAA